MKSRITKRLFKAVSMGTREEVVSVCQSIIEDEKSIGHTVLAKQLENILKENSGKEIKRAEHESSDSLYRELKELPRSRRHKDLLLTRLPCQALRHHMILPDNVEERFRTIEKEFVARERLAKHGLQHKKKILLYGAPGCGKTLGAERLAHNTGLTLLKVRFDALISSYLGESAVNLRAIFEAAAESPCLLLLDECDFIAKSREVSNDVGEIPRIVNTLLQLLEDYNAPGLLVATTNLDKSLDSALFRRFDDVFEVPAPGEKEIVHLLKLSLSSLEVEKSINWKEVAKSLRGCSASAVVKIAEQAAKRTILDSRKMVTRQDLEAVAPGIYH